MADYIDHCINEGLMTLSEYFDLIEAGEDDIDDPEICVHEAGHAVAAYVVGRPIEYVSACEWGEDDGIECADGGMLYIGSPGGVVRYAEEIKRPLTESETVARMHREMMTALAGAYTVHRYTGLSLAEGMSEGDRFAFANAFYSFCLLNGERVRPPFEIPADPRNWHQGGFPRWCEANKPPISERDLWAEVAHIIDEHWDLVEGLAAALIANACLDGPEVYKIFDRVKARRAASN